MFFRFSFWLLGILTYPLTGGAADLAVGQTVANVETIEVRDSAGQTVDRIGPGEILVVIETRPGQVLVSRGSPGWVDNGQVMSLAAAEASLESRFRIGAGPTEYLARGNIRIARGKTDLGLADLRKAVEFSGNPADQLPALGFGLLRSQRHAEAITTFTRAIELGRDAVQPYVGRGLAYFQAGQLRQAKADFAKATRLAPENAMVQKYAGIVAHDLGETSRANELLERSRELDRYDPHTHRALGRLQYEQGELAVAMASFDEAIRLAPSDPEGFVGRGVVGYALGNDLPQVRSDYVRAIAGEPASEENAHLYANLGQVLWELGETEKAIEHLNVALELDPSNLEAVSVRILARLDRTDETERGQLIQACRGDITRVFTAGGERSYWDYRALAALNAVLGDYTRAARFQRAAVQKSSRGPYRRFHDSALETLTRYSEKEHSKTVDSP